MTRTTRKSLAKKFIVFATAALMAFVLALQLVSVPTFIKAPSSNPVNADAMNGVSVSYKQAPNGLDPTVVNRSDAAVESEAKSSAPKPDDTVDVIITLAGTSMMDYASERGLKVSEALATEGGIKNLNELKSIRNNAMNGISAYIRDSRLTYTTVMNGFSATVKYGDIQAIESNRYVTSVILSDTYAVPQAITENYVDVYESGIFNSSGIGYDGVGTVVAVVDTGTDYTHEVFDMELDVQTIAITKDDVAAVAPELAATSQSAAVGDSIDEDDLYIKSKLPFAYDYADSDANVYPHNSHGTHVAGIIAGKSDVITGVAPAAQIATFKVFSDYQDGAKTEWILAGLNDAVLLGVDAINMSLGTSCGFTREEDEAGINEIYDRINAAGICLVVAASNDYSSAQGSTWGNTNLATNPDSGTVGSPASYDASLSVASISGIKTKYFTVDGQEVYFAESRMVGKTDPNDFVTELLGDKAEGEYEYVVVPGVGMSVNYSNVDVTGKIAVVRRGTTNFEEKVRIAADKGAVAVIVYNNVSGTISMSVGTRYRIPSCFVTMDLSEYMVSKGSGTIKLSKDYLAGPFMSDFSSWGVLPNLKLAPDITAHGGEIYSAVAGGDAYDRYSGTSMAAPNLAGALILVRQFVKEQHPEYTTNEVRDETYSRMMSTSTIVRNEEGNPYSPRKQGSGLANLAGSINTKAYLTVDGSNKPKLSLGDDPNRSGVYTMNFNIVNTSDTALSYDLSTYVMTESMSSDDRTVAEKAYMFDDAQNTYEVSATAGSAFVSGNRISVSGHGVAVVKVTVSLSAADKEYLEYWFSNGMYIEGYVMLKSFESDGVDLSIPYLAFYGDWKDAPMLDVSAYEVGESAADDSVLEDDKLKADQYGTLPYSGFDSSTAADGIAYWGMGQFAYMPPAGYPEEYPARERYAALTSNPDGDYLFYMVSAGLLRGAKRVEMEIRDSATGELIWSGTDYNARKAHANGGTPIGGMVDIQLDISKLNLPNNSKYTFTMECFLDWEDPDNKDSENLALKYHYGNNNKFSFEFTVDNEKPELSDVAVRKVKSGSSYNYYLDMTVYDNHYLQGFSLSTYSKSTYNEDYDTDEFEDFSSITGGVVPVNGNYNSDTVLTVNITSYWSKIMANGGNLYLTCMDYAKNFNSMFIKLEEYRKEDLTIEPTRAANTANNRFGLHTNGQIDLADYVIVKANVGNNVYLENYWAKDLTWESSDSTVADVQNGLVTGVKAGTATITVRTSAPDEEYDENDPLRCIRFEITVDDVITDMSLTGIELTVSSLTLERGETATIAVKEFRPYNYPDQDNLKLNWVSTSSAVQIIDYAEDGRSVTVQAIDSGSASVRVSIEGSRVSGFCSVNVKQEYLMTNNIYLRSYTGRGDKDGVVEIPDDMGIVYIYPQAFVANKYIKKVIIPEGVTTIMRAAFASCENLEEVVLPSTVEAIETAAFSNCEKLKKINLGKVKTIGQQAFWHSGVEELDLSSCTYIDSFAFIYCHNLKELDLSHVGIVGGGAFAHCQGLESVTIPENTSMGSQPYTDGGVFSGCLNLKSVTIYSDNVGVRAFSGCTALEKVTFMNDVNVIDDMAFQLCIKLSEVEFKGRAYRIGYSAFAGCAIRNLYLPAGLTILGERAFAGNGIWNADGNYVSGSTPTLTTVTISSGALLTEIGEGCFLASYIQAFNVEDGNKYLSSENGVLFDNAKKRLIAYPSHRQNTSYTVPNTVKTIGEGAFSHARFWLDGYLSVNLNNVEYIEDSAFYSARVSAITGYSNVKYIGAYAFTSSQITNLPFGQNVEYIGTRAFYTCENLGNSNRRLNIGGNIASIGDQAFARMNITSVTFGDVDNLVYLGSGAFAGNQSLETVDFGALDRIGENMFGEVTYTHLNNDDKIVTEYYYCDKLTSITIPASVKSIGYGAFRGSALENVTFASGSVLKSIPSYAFVNTKISSIALPSTVTSIGAHAFEKTSLAGELDLGNVEEIGAYAFSETAVTSVKASNATYIGEAAFKNDVLLTSANIDKVETIGNEAFDGCTALETVASAAAKTIGERAFGGVAVSSLTLNNAVSIGASAFDGAESLSSITLGSVQTIGANAFNGTAITVLNLPDTVKSISDGAFMGAGKLTEINIADGTSYFSEDGVLYFNTESKYNILIGYPAGKTDTSYSVLERTIKLGAYSFDGNTHLTELTLPAHMQIIGASAMSGMSNLKKLTIMAPIAPTLESVAEYHEETVTVKRQESDEYGNPIEGKYRDIEETRHTYTNKYDNFGFAYDEVNGADPDRDFTVVIPANNMGYDNRIWTKYVGIYLQATDKIQATVATLNLIDRIKALPQNPSAADADEINSLARLYNIMNAAQRAIINGGEYNYSQDVTVTDENGNEITVTQTIDSEYYKKLLGGVNYRAILTAAQNKLPSTAASVALAPTPDGVKAYNQITDTVNIALAVLCASILAVIAVFSVAAIIKRRSR